MSRDDVIHTDADGADLIRSCTRKKGYPTEAIAREAARTIRSLNPDASVRPYGCRSCGRWHVGGVPRDERDTQVVPYDEDEAPRERPRFERRTYGDKSVFRPRRAPRRRRGDRDD